MDFAPAEKAHQIVSRFLQGKAVTNSIAVIARHRDRVFVAKKIRRMQHYNMQRVAFDPFAAIDQAPQRPELPANLDAEGIFDRMDGAHLIGDRADAADAGHDIRGFEIAPAAQECLEKARRLENAEARLLRRGRR